MPARTNPVLFTPVWGSVGGAGVLVGVGLAEDLDDSDIHLQWQDNSSDENGFRVKRRIGYDVIPQSDMPTDSEGVFLPGSPRNSLICYAVSAYNGYGQSPWTPEVCVQTT